MRNLIEAYRRDIDTLDWMSPETKKGAQEKLAKLVPKIGYPDHWRDYGALAISRATICGATWCAAPSSNMRATSTSWASPSTATSGS